MNKSLLALLFLLPTLVFSQVPDGYDPLGHPKKTERNGYIEPFKMFDNVYYVGDKWVSSYLVTTDAGLVLIDTLEAPFAQWIIPSIISLNFKPDDIKHIFITHGHSDHLGGASFLQEKTGAKVYMHKADITLAKEQATSSTFPFAMPQSIEFVSDGDLLTFGNTQLTIHHTPGHTLGTISIEFLAQQGDKAHRSLVYGGMGANFSGVQQAQLYIDSVKKISALNTPKNAFEVNLANHPHMADIFEKKIRNAKIEERNAYVDPDGFKRFIDKLLVRGQTKHEKEESILKESEKPKSEN